MGLFEDGNTTPNLWLCQWRCPYHFDTAKLLASFMWSKRLDEACDEEGTPKDIAGCSFSILYNVIQISLSLEKQLLMVWRKKTWRTVKVDSGCGCLARCTAGGRPCNMFVLFLFHKIETHSLCSIHFCTYVWKMFVFHMILFESHPLIRVLDPNVDGYISLTQLHSSYKSTFCHPHPWFSRLSFNPLFLYPPYPTVVTSRHLEVSTRAGATPWSPAWWCGWTTAPGFSWTNAASRWREAPRLGDGGMGYPLVN